MSIYIENLLLTVGVFIILGWACYLPLLGGQLFNGSIYCAALSAYFAAYTTKVLGWPIALGIAGGVGFSGIISLGMAFFLAPLTMFQMAVVTMALIFIVQTTFRNLEFLGGVIGMSGIPRVDNILLVCGIFILISLVLIIFTDVLAAYGFAKFEFRGKTVLFWVMIGTTMLPIYTTLIPSFWLFSKLKMINTYQALILPGVVDAYGIFLLKQYMETIPNEPAGSSRAAASACSRPAHRPRPARHRPA